MDHYASVHNQLRVVTHNRWMVDQPPLCRDVREMTDAVTAEMFGIYNPDSR